ncbi:hypothetical protein UFOVP146_53 [uncultured Caudovirales phage]|uniref:Uncharacterized protein n=1 Tax=uncultured Caudovirales phage TaxID=2100421 RepID=A0A6J7VNN7_9CAUD|nr:hypothetical protein UFOVP146_53 [uncultured Caudovirales phage]
MTEQQFLEWKTQEATEKFFDFLKKAKLEAQEAWANRQFTTEGENQFALGGVFAINQILDLTHDEITGE